MREQEESKPKPGFFSRMLNRINLWYMSIGNSEDLPDPDTQDYVDLEDVDFSHTDLLIISSKTSTFFAHVLCIALTAAVVCSLYFTEKPHNKDGLYLLWTKRAMIFISILGYILYFYNKRMVSLFKFEERFEQYLRESDMEPYEKHQITQMKAIDPGEYYKTVENYYHTQYPSLSFYVILSDDIKEYPKNGIARVFYILLLFLKEIFGIRPGRNLSYTSESQAPSLYDSIPTVKALVFYEWVPNDFYELLLKYYFLSHLY